MDGALDDEKDAIECVSSAVNLARRVGLGDSDGDLDRTLDDLVCGDEKSCSAFDVDE